MRYETRVMNLDDDEYLEWYTEPVEHENVEAALRAVYGDVDNNVYEMPADGLIIEIRPEGTEDVRRFRVFLPPVQVEEQAVA